MTKEKKRLWIPETLEIVPLQTGNFALPIQVCLRFNAEAKSKFHANPWQNAAEFRQDEPGKWPESTWKWLPYATLKTNPNKVLFWRCLGNITQFTHVYTEQRGIKTKKLRRENPRLPWQFGESERWNFLQDLQGICFKSSSNLQTLTTGSSGKCLASESQKTIFACVVTSICCVDFRCRCFCRGMVRRCQGRDCITPIPSMYGIITYIWLIFMVNVGKYNIHGSYGTSEMLSFEPQNKNKQILFFTGWAWSSRYPRIKPGGQWKIIPVEYSGHLQRCREI